MVTSGVGALYQVCCPGHSSGKRRRHGEKGPCGERFWLKESGAGDWSLFGGTMSHVLLLSLLLDVHYTDHLFELPSRFGIDVDKVFGCGKDALHYTFMRGSEETCSVLCCEEK